MSGERNIPRPRPALPLVSSHARPVEPFAKADDVEDLADDEVQEIPESYPPPVDLTGLNNTVSALVLAQQGTTLAVQAMVETVGKHDDLITDLLTRMTPVEQAQRTLPQKVAGGTMAGMKWTAYISLALFVLNTAAKKWPELAEVAQWVKENASLLQ